MNDKQRRELMLNQEQVELLKQGATVWNRWRQEYPKVRPDLRNANLGNAHLSGAHLDNANLSGANLRSAFLATAHLNNANLSFAHLNFTHFGKAHLSNANLSNADLSEADLSNADLSGADLRFVFLSSANFILADLSFAHLGKASLNYANLSGANLSGADLSDANLSNTNLSGANLSGANFHKTMLFRTILAAVDLCTVNELDTVIHEGPSFVDVKTVRFPEGETRILFLQGVGFPDPFIDDVPSLLTAASQYASCFISYAHQDEALAQRLYKDLQDKGVRCWFAPHDLKPGTLFHGGIENAIHAHEVVLLLLSEHAIASNWIAYEVETARNRQARERRDLLFPLRLDETILLAKDDWAVRLRESQHIGDFTNWQDDAIYQQHFVELLRHLKVKTTK
jgi:uncharacterized protein YjbI with pentapeptide repeats